MKANIIKIQLYLYFNDELTHRQHVLITQKHLKLLIAYMEERNERI